MGASTSLLVICNIKFVVKAFKHYGGFLKKIRLAIGYTDSA